MLENFGERVMDRLGKSLEDYLEAIFLLSKEKDRVRITDIAERLSVRKPSVVSAIKKLEEKGFVTHERYGHVELTPMGKELAEDIYYKHTMLLKFFRDILGVESDEAERDACIMEHYLGDSTLMRLAKLVEFIEEFEKRGVRPKWLEHFKRYVETGELPQCRHVRD